MARLRFAAARIQNVLAILLDIGWLQFNLAMNARWLSSHSGHRQKPDVTPFRLLQTFLIKANSLMSVQELIVSLSLFRDCYGRWSKSRISSCLRNQTSDTRGEQSGAGQTS